MSTPRDPDFDWRIRLRHMSEDEVAEVIENLESKLQKAREFAEGLREEAKGYRERMEVERAGRKRLYELYHAADQRARDAEEALASELRRTGTEHDSTSEGPAR